MKLVSATALFLLAPLCVSIPSPSFFDSQSPIKADSEGPPVNGDNPLTYCTDPSSYILSIDTVNLKPNPPEALVSSQISLSSELTCILFSGQTLTINASGSLSQTIEDGAKVLLMVKYGLITILKGELDLCDQLQEVDLSCPVQKGDLSLTKRVDLPQRIPPVRRCCRLCAHPRLLELMSK